MNIHIHRPTYWTRGRRKQSSNSDQKSVLSLSTNYVDMIKRQHILNFAILMNLQPPANDVNAAYHNPKVVKIRIKFQATRHSLQNFEGSILKAISMKLHSCTNDGKESLSNHQFNIKSNSAKIIMNKRDLELKGFLARNRLNSPLVPVSNYKGILQIK